MSFQAMSKAMTLKEAHTILVNTYTEDDGILTTVAATDEVFEAWDVIRNRIGAPPIKSVFDEDAK